MTKHHRSRRRAADAGVAGLAADIGARSGLLTHSPGAYALVPVGASADRVGWAVGPADVLIALCRYRDARTGMCCPSIDRLAEDLGVSRSTIKRCLGVLKAAGRIIIERQVGGRQGGYRSSQYHVIFGKAEPRTVELEPEPRKGEIASSGHVKPMALDRSPSDPSKNLHTLSWEQLVDNPSSMGQMVNHPDGSDGEPSVSDSWYQTHEDPSVPHGTSSPEAGDHEAQQEEWEREPVSRGRHRRAA